MRCRVASLLLLGAHAVAADDTPPTVTIDLDADPSTRWAAIVTKYNASLWASVAEVESTSSTYKTLLTAANALFHNESNSGWLPREHWEELAGIVRITKLPVGVLVALNSLYDVTASKQVAHHACTSIVAQSNDGSVIAGRNLDYTLKTAMRNITVTVDCKPSRRVSTPDAIAECCTFDAIAESCTLDARVCPRTQGRAAARPSSRRSLTWAQSPSTRCSGRARGRSHTTSATKASLAPIGWTYSCGGAC